MNRSVVLGCCFLSLMFGVAIGSRLPAQFASVPVGTMTSTITAGPSSCDGELKQYCFSPGGNCARILTLWFDRAQVSIHALIYSFTLGNVRDALIHAKNRGVDVSIVMDKDNIDAPGSAYHALRSAGINIRIDSNRALMHDKFVVIDNHVIITGSYNWTSTANEENNENMIVIDNSTWARAYEEQFQAVHRAGH